MVFKINQDDLPHITALGAVVVEWGHLESDVSGLLYTFCDFADSDDKREKFYATFGHLDLRNRISICRTRGYLHAKVMPDGWYTSLTDILNYIENDLRIIRNRYIHDIWLLQGRGRKIHCNPKVKSPKQVNLHWRLVSPKSLRPTKFCHSAIEYAQPDASYRALSA